jgi:fatty acid/phospholipid biosynthesis enzyme
MSYQRKIAVDVMGWDYGIAAIAKAWRMGQNELLQLILACKTKTTTFAEHFY